MTSVEPAVPGVAAGEQVKACCAAAYSSDLVAMLLGDSYHPGGRALTRRLAGALSLAPGARVLDVACGRGTTALLLAAEYDAHVVGVDLSAEGLAAATASATESGLADRVDLRVGDAEHLPVGDGQFDAVVCECALCTFPAKAAAVRELARALRPGGRLGLTDVTADRSRLPENLTSLAAWVACVADARPMPAYVDLVAAAGLRVTLVERHDRALTGMLDQIEARLRLLRLTAPGRLEAAGLDLRRAQVLLDAATAAVSDGLLGYGLLVAEKPT